MKKKVYILLVMVLGFLLSTIAHALLERWYIDARLSDGTVLENNGFMGSTCYLPKYVSYSLWLSGIVGGYFLGKAWWRIVYIEKRHWRKRGAKKA